MQEARELTGLNKNSYLAVLSSVECKRFHIPGSGWLYLVSDLEAAMIRLKASYIQQYAQK